MTPRSRALARWFAGALLGVLALALNRVQLNVLTEETPLFVFGGALVLVAFVRCGIGPGLVAAAISLVELVGGGGAVGWVTSIYALESLVAYLLWRRWRSLVLGVLCFWLSIGWMLDLALYQRWIGLQPAYVMLLFVKQLFNGLLNAGLAEGILYLSARFSISRPRADAFSSRPEPLRAFVFNRLAFVLLLPALAVGLLHARTIFGERLAHTQGEQLRRAGEVADGLREVVGGWHREIEALARSLAREPRAAVDTAAHFRATMERQSDLLALVRLDAEGRVVESLVAPAATAQLLSIASLSAEDFAQVRESEPSAQWPFPLAPRVADGAGDPVLRVVAACQREGAFDGVILALFEGRTIQSVLDRAASSSEETILLLDQERLVIAASGRSVPAGTPLATLAPAIGELPDSSPRSLSFYGAPSSRLESQLGIDRHYSAFHPVRPLGYGLLVNRRASHLYREMVGPSAQVVGFLVGLLALVYLVVAWVGRQIGDPLQAVHAAAGDIAAGHSEDAGHALRRLAASPIEELRVTAVHLEEMRGVLAQKESRRAERLRLAADIARLVTIEWEPASDRIVAGGHARQFFGGAAPADLDELVARLHPDDRDRVLAELRRVAASRAPGAFELQVVPASAAGGENEAAVERGASAEGAPRGSWDGVRWLEARAEALCDEHGETTRVLCVATDVTEQRRAEAALRESQERYRVLFEGVPIGIGLADGQGRVLAFNDAMLRPGGYSRSDIHPETKVTDFYADLEERRALLRELAESGFVRQREVRFSRKDGGTYVGQVSLQPVEIDGRPYVLAMVEDTTARRLLQDQLLRAQKLEAVGRLAGGLAHDFNNLVTVILGCTELALKGVSTDDPRRALLHSVEEAGRRAAELTRQLLAFSRRQVVQPRLVELSELVRGFERMLRRFLGENVELVVRPGSELWHSRVDPGQLEQVLINLVLNARDAMPAGGTVTVTTANLTSRGDDARYPRMPPGDYVSLAVSDTGTGMSQEVLEQVFEPFFTTKEAGEGTGLGLATCYGIVKQASGFIWARSRQGAGTTIEVLLPRAAVEPGAHLPDGRLQPSVVVPRGHERVLLVEDEPAVNRLAERILRDLGYTVQAAWSGEEALSLVERNGEIDLLLTDIRLPQQSGRELAESVRTRQPRARVLFMSGYAEDLRGTLAGDEGVAFLAKPFTASELARKVRGVLDA
ncbi:MAG TPA: ATP-binding protein [Thermoanaerobaculia bacterium]|nr:ATP-binding protein [Thermoanaerobaculia bacterium]